MSLGQINQWPHPCPGSIPAALFVLSFLDIAINHDPDAILMHRTNHPHTQHFQASVWDVDPEEVCRGRPVGLLWASTSRGAPGGPAPRSGTPPHSPG